MSFRNIAIPQNANYFRASDGKLVIVCLDLRVMKSVKRKC